MKNSKLVMVFVLLLSLSLLIGCGGGGGGGGSVVTNPVAVTPDPTNPVVPGAPIGSSQISVSIVFPSLSLRQSAAVSGSGTVLGKLYVNDVLNQQKTATVNAGAATLVFSGVPDSGTARVDLALTGCHIYGVTKFTGSAAIGSNIVLSVTPVYPEGTLKTADGRVITALGTPNNLGWTMSAAPVAFNDLGQPIGYHTDGWILNFVTGEKLLSTKGLKYDGYDIGVGGLAWYNGKLLIGFLEMIYQRESDGTLTIFSGQRHVYTDTVDGATKANATFSGVDKMMVINGTLYLSTVTRFLKLEGDTFRVVSTPSHFDEFSMTEDGEIFLLNYSANGKLNVAKLIGTDLVIQPQFEPTDPNQQATMDVIKYKDGYLQAIVGQVRFIRSGSVPVTFISKESVGAPAMGTFGVYKNHLGEVFLHSDSGRKIWKLN